MPNIKIPTNQGEKDITAEIIDLITLYGGAGSASSNEYDNSSSGLDAENTQDAIDEVVSDVENIQDDIDDVVSDLKAGDLENSIQLSKGLFELQSNLQAGLIPLSNMAIDTFNNDDDVSGDYTYDAVNDRIYGAGGGEADASTYVEYNPATNGGFNLQNDPTNPYTQSVLSGSVVTDDVLNDILNIQTAFDADSKIIQYIRTEGTMSTSTTKIFKANFKLHTTSGSGARFYLGIDDGTKYMRVVANKDGSLTLNGTDIATGKNFTSDFVELKLIVNGTDDVEVYLDETLIDTDTYANGSTSTSANTFIIGVQDNSTAGTRFVNVYINSVDYTLEYQTQTIIGDLECYSSSLDTVSIPTQGYLIVDDFIPSGASITYYLSRDDGTTWTEVTEETLTDLTSQPSGSNLRIKAVSSGGDSESYPYIEGWAFGYK